MTVSNNGMAMPSVPPKIDCSEAIQDSPKFRATVAQHAMYFNRLENRLNEMLRHITAMIDFSKNYTNTFYKLTVSVNQLCDESFSGNPLASTTFQGLSEAYAHTVNLFRTYFDHSNVVTFTKLSNFIKIELTKVAESRAHFENMSQSMDDALVKNASISRQKPADATEGRNALTAVGTCFAHTTLDYVANINIAHAHKDHMILDALWTLVRESSAFFSKGHATFDEWTAADNGAIADTIQTFAAKSKLIERKMQDVHSLVPKEMFQHPSGMPIEPDVMMEGYLYKRSSNAFKTWNRRWFQIKDKQLLYSHRSTDLEPATIMEENLRICLVRPAPSNIDRIGCFELVTPTRIHLLQADSESLCQDWMRALQRTILALHEGDSVDVASTSPRNKTTSMSSGVTLTSANAISPLSNAMDVTKGRSVSDPASTYTSANTSSISTAAGFSSSTTAFEQVRRVPGNEVCADCGSPAPKWVSINLGVVLCIECSGAHRSLGVQTSKVRSLCMDSIDNELRDVLLALGNRQVNEIFLAHLPPADSIVPPQINEKSARPAREAWIKAKYVERRFAVAEDTRARSSATNRQEHLKHKTSIGGNSSSNGVNRSSSYADVQDAESGGLLDADPWSADLSVPVPTASKRLSACGSDTNLDAIGSSSIDTKTVEWDSVKEACECGDLLALMTAYAQGFDLNALHNGTTALHIATRNGQTAAVEFLLLNGAKINMLDEKLNTPLHLAAKEGHTLPVCQLLKRGADSNLANVDSKTPLDIAMECTHADIVTLFRVTIMRNDFNADFNNPMDETVEAVISDIARRAATEKEQKKTESLKSTSDI
ncbi:Truncated cnt-1 [Caenorhabditis elegans]|uniref:Arf-GAP with ANK repeat and PH domain-containing protein cnt-1 n=3 Tax=Caenorhabditis elegans TaxID=6239 RepID=CNT1_CAEEL|nr:Truncated ctn-1 [Caenorhabditis elegans]Q9XXH8.2 RecName: Full=Arf-GAP with ANK repeat and PH domain-containing protein cnt-1; AltName: Full=CED-3 protease suppressor; AltName: Full=Centaurin 1; Contains: RecName: Full=Truncated ctn-1; Short=tCNT-1; Flags: Precursor [Caenorhabditis elegans]CAA19463.2 Truncated ctn-1 [Caenorhabditis elegans]|eukprot:NP_001022412.1 Truncated ctn-1 [Caenorhabditis elegans]